jgi:hypothetical protein
MQIAEVCGMDPQSHEVIVLDIFNRRNGQTLEPTGYLPTFLDALVSKQLLDPKFLYGQPE